MISRFRFNAASIFIMVIIIALATFASWSYYRYIMVRKQVSALSSIEGQQQLAQEQVSQLIEKVGKHMILPRDEEPTVANVTDADALKKEQPFFESAKNGNQVLVYAQAKKAILYDSTEDIIVNVGSVSIDHSASPIPSSSPLPTPFSSKRP